MSSSAAPLPSLDGRTLVGVSNSGGGEVDAATVFTYHEHDGLIWAEYAGGTIALGRIAGTRQGDTLDFRYVHVSTDGTSSAGHCRAQLEQLPDGRLRSHESWRWESRPGTGDSVVEECAVRRLLCGDHPAESGRRPTPGSCVPDR